MDVIPENIVDFHTHLFPDKLIDAIWGKFLNDYNWDVIYRLYHRECIDFLKRHHVSHIVYSNYAHKKGVAEGLNRWNRSVLDEFPHLYCFAAIHPDDENCMEIAKNIISHPKVLGFKLQHLVQHFYPYDERLFPIYDLVMEKDKRILFHVGTGPVASPYVGIQHFEKLLKTYPDIPANVAHMGAFECREFMDLLDDHSDLYFDTSFAFFNGMDMGFNLDPSYLEKNKDRIVYGSDFPNLIFPREEEIDTLVSLGLSDEFYQKVFFNNGMELIKRHSTV